MNHIQAFLYLINRQQTSQYEGTKEKKIGNICHCQRSMWCTQGGLCILCRSGLSLLLVCFHLQLSSSNGYFACHKSSRQFPVTTINYDLVQLKMLLLTRMLEMVKLVAEWVQEQIIFKEGRKI